MSRGTGARALAVLTLAGLIGWWASTHLEWVEQTRPARPGEAALRNHLLALERLLTRAGYPTGRVEERTELARLPARATLYAGGLAHSGLVAAALPGLDTWVRGGGHLVLAVHGVGGSDRLARHFGVTDSAPFATLGAATVVIEGRALEVDMPDCNAFRAPPDAQWVVSLPLRYRRVGRGRAAAGPDDLTGFAAAGRWRWGAGRVTALCSARPLRNRDIGRHDNAELATRVMLTEDTTAVRLYPDSATGSGLLGWLLRHAWPMLVGLALVAALSLWRALVRFGPVYPAPPVAAPGLIRHLEAAAAFLLRRHAYDRLLAGPREHTRRLIERHGAGATDARAAERAGRAAGLAAATVLDALHGATRNRAAWRARALTLARVADALRARTARATPARSPPTEAP